MSAQMQVFGEKLPNVHYEKRRSVYGLVTKDERLAIVARRRAGSFSYFELPGGSVETGETERQALIREFKEETGLLVRPEKRFSEMTEFFRRSDGESYIENNSSFWICAEHGWDLLQQEEGHKLCWMDADAAIINVRQESHAHFICQWLRWPERDQQFYSRRNASSEFSDRG